MTKFTQLSVLALAALALGCNSQNVEPTEVVLVVDTDLVAPLEVDAVVVSVFDVTGAEMMSRASVDVGQPRFPRTLGIVNDTGRLGPFRVVARATLRGTRVVERMATFDFVPDRTMRLRLFLPSLCSDVRCDPDLTCTEGGVCRSPAGVLTPWNGSVSPLVQDAGVDSL